MATRIVEHIESHGYDIKADGRPAQFQPPTTADMDRRRNLVELIEYGDPNDIERIAKALGQDGVEK